MAEQSISGQIMGEISEGHVSKTSILQFKKLNLIFVTISASFLAEQQEKHIRESAVRQKQNELVTKRKYLKMLAFERRTNTFD